MREKISACIIAFNEERKIRRCIESVRWCDEILVVDSFSTDRTVEICREYTDRVVQREWLGYVGQRNMIRDMATHPWILYLDSDEEVSIGLRDEILHEFEYPDGTAGFEFPRQVFYLGRWIRHGEWYPDVKLRLFRKELGRTEGIEPHDRVHVRGAIKRLKNPVWHYTYDDTRDHMETINRFSTITAQQKYVAGSRFNWFDLFFRTWFHFFKGYILRLGFLDGAHGLLIAILCSYGAFLKYAKLWELERRRSGSMKDFPETYPDPR